MHRSQKFVLYPLSFFIRQQAVSSSHDNTVIIWNFKSNIRPFIFIGHKKPVLSICPHPNGTEIAS